jgi:succinyl-CoA synthetase beta subunit
MLQGGKAGNFLDLGGGATKERIKAALQFVLSDPRISVLFVNVLGGMTRADDTALAIVEAQRDGVKPIVVRLLGTNEKEGKRLLVEAGIKAYDSMVAAAKEAVRLSKEGKHG